MLRTTYFKVEDWCLVKCLILNPTNTLQIIFKALNKVLKNPQIYDFQRFSIDISIIRYTKFLAECNLACLLFVVGGWPKSNCHNWTVAKLKPHNTIAYRTTNNGRQLMSDWLRPTNQSKPTQAI